eukprot:s2348_g9.t1
MTVNITGWLQQHGCVGAVVGRLVSKGAVKQRVQLNCSILSPEGTRFFTAKMIANRSISSERRLLCNSQLPKALLIGRTD